MFYLVGLGLGDASDITVKGLEIAKTAKRVYLEAYTSILTVGKDALVSDRAGITTIKGSESFRPQITSSPRHFTPKMLHSWSFRPPPHTHTHLAFCIHPPQLFRPLYIIT